MAEHHEHPTARIGDTEIEYVRQNGPRYGCPGCGGDYNYVECENGKRPKAGDVSLCARCLTVSIFTETLTRRLPTSQELLEIEADDEARETLRDRKANIAQRNTVHMAAIRGFARNN